MGLKLNIKSLSFADETPEEEVDESLVWDSKKVIEVKKKIEMGQPVTQSPFFIKDSPDWKRAGITYKWTIEEFSEYVRCMNDVVYFAEKFAYSMTDDGIVNIKLRPYQKIILERFQKNPYVVFLASRQIGKCVYGNTQVNVRIDGEEQTLTLRQLYDLVNPKVSLKDKIVGALYKALKWLENQSKKTSK